MPDPHAPVTTIPGDEGAGPPKEGVVLCLSGGGYRAMLFHLGALRRLNEIAHLPKLKRVSSVSGGSITAGVLGMNWGKLQFQNDVAVNFEEFVTAPLRKLASVTIDGGSIIGGILIPGVSIADKVIRAYRKHLFGDATLQDLPPDADGPRFIINATNVQSGALMRFSRRYIADYRVGRVLNPTLPLADAVAASSAFPPVLSPVILDFEEKDWTKDPGNDLHRAPFTTDVWLTDGGVYDNLGLETAWKNYATVLVSDGGGKTQPDASPDGDWGRHSKRVLDLVDNQVRSLRKRQLIESYQAPAGDVNHREGTYWGIRTNVADYSLPATPQYPFTPQMCPHDKTLRIAEMATRLRAMGDREQELLINWGYAVCDVAIRKHVDDAVPKPTGFPYPGTGVG